MKKLPKSVRLADQDKLTTTYTEKAVRFIEQHKKQHFFLYLPHSMVHIPLGVSEKFRGKSKQGMYGDVMMEVDWSIGEIMKALKKNGLEKNTLVIFTSDNGPWLNFGNHAGTHRRVAGRQRFQLGRRSAGSMYNEMARCDSPGRNMQQACKFN